MDLGLSFNQYKQMAESSLRTMGFRKNSEPMVEAMARKLMRWGIPDSETAVKECHMYLIEMEAQYGLAFRTEQEYTNHKGERCGYVCVVKQETGSSLTKIPYTVDAETGKIQIELPDPLHYASDVFNDLIKELQEYHDREMSKSKKKSLERDER